MPSQPRSAYSTKVGDLGETTLSDDLVFPVPADWAARAQMNAGGYEAAVRRVEEDPQGYWTDVARRLDWIKPFTIAKDVSFDREDFRIAGETKSSRS